MGQKLKAILILMVLFTFASLLSEPPAEKTAPVVSTPAQTPEKQLASPADQEDVTDSNEPVVTEPEPAPATKTIADVDSVEEEQETESGTDIKSISEPDAAEKVSENTYQDDDWRIGVRIWMPILSDDMKTLGTYATNMDFEGMDSRSRLFKSDCNFALKESQKYTVSPELEESKAEYESALADFMVAADDIQSAVDNVNNNEVDAAIEQINTANVYINSGAEHMTAAAEAAT